MAKLNKIQKSGILNLDEMIKVQLILHFYFANIKVSEYDLESLVLLSILGPSDLSQFCDAVSSKDYRNSDVITSISKEIFKTPQSARNALTRLENKNIIVKEGTSKKKIKINPDINVVVKGNILLDIKFLRKDDTPES